MKALKITNDLKFVVSRFHLIYDLIDTPFFFSLDFPCGNSYEEIID